MLPRASPTRWIDSQKGQNTPDEKFFESKNFDLLELTQKRKEEADERAWAKIKEERSRRETIRLLKLEQDDEIGYYSQLYRADGNPPPAKPRVPPQTFFGLRRPLNAQEHRIVGAIPSWEKDHKEWTDKPYSTVFTGPYGYTGHFPLLMQINSESEDMDVTVIQTETRRRSIVTTNYAKGTIKLESDEEDIKYAVFPLLHVVVDTETEDSSSLLSSSGKDDNTSSEGGDESDSGSTPRNRPPPLLPEDVLERLAAIAAQRTSDDEESSDSEEAEPPQGWFEHTSRRLHDNRRLSITTRPCAEKPRTLKRRSLDFGALFYHHEVESMDTIEEGNDADVNSSSKEDDNIEVKKSTGMMTTMIHAPAGNWARDAGAKAKAWDERPRDVNMLVRRAEMEMSQIGRDCHKFEKFLKHDSSDESS